MQLPEIRSEYERIRLTWEHVMRQRQAGYPEYLRSLGDSAESQGDAQLALACRDLASRLSSFNADRAEHTRNRSESSGFHTIDCA